MWLGSGIINADGALWKAQRKAGLHFLNNANLQFLTEVALPRYLRRAVKSLQDVAHDVVVDLENVFNELTTQLMGHMAYGMDMHADDPFSLAFDYASAATGNRFQNPLWSITELFFGLKFRRSVAVVKRFGRQIVANAVTSRAIEKPCEDLSQEDILSGSLINSLLDSIPDHEVVADAALNFLTAGRDTTGQTLTWTFYLLMRHPSVILKIRKEVDDLVNNAGENHVEGLSLPMIRPSSLPFTMAVLYESLRLYPPIPFEIRQCVESTTLPDGTFLPKNAVLVWCLWAMNRSELIWGADPQDFRPERWIDEGRLVNKSAFEFPVFNGGPRACLGKKMAESIAVMAIATLIWEFDFSAVDQKERISKNSLTLPMEDGLPCRVRKRKATV
ncbi:MAG: hypothetical protein M1818_003366 [Claussenomyces sp. TS43310]|nr:MAG: hypothetical protein M1818_003366 [Claussenomyces sp. TS43310]